MKRREWADLPLSSMWAGPKPTRHLSLWLQWFVQNWSHDLSQPSPLSIPHSCHVSLDRGWKLQRWQTSCFPRGSTSCLLPACSGLRDAERNQSSRNKPWSSLHESVEQNREPRNRLTHPWSVNLWQRRQEYIYIGEKRVFSASGGGRAGQLHVNQRSC